MICFVCKKVGNLKVGKYSFNLGFKRVCFLVVIDYKKSLCYNWVVEILILWEDVKKRLIIVYKIVLVLNELIRKYIEIKFRNVYVLIKKNRFIFDFVWLNELDEVKGIVYGVIINNQNVVIGFFECIFDVEKDYYESDVEDESEEEESGEEESEIDLENE